MDTAAVAQWTAGASAQAARRPSQALIRFAWLVTSYNVLVVLWGAVVRATGSGAGCGDHWPLCNGTVLQHWQSLATVIEYAHRATSGVALLLLVALAGWTWRGTPRRHLARVAVGAAAVLTFNEALLGALLVLLGHTAQDHSPARGVYLSLHLANTLLLLGALTLCAHFLGRSAGKMRGTLAWAHPGASLGALGTTLLLGVSGSLAALGDTLYPAHTLHDAFAQDLGGSAGSGTWLLRLRLIHPTASVLAALCILLLVRVGRRQASTRGQAGLVAGLLAAQLGLGAADVLLLAPTYMQVLHLLFADLLWIALVVLAARLSVLPVGCATAGGRCARTAPAATAAST